MCVVNENDDSILELVLKRILILNSNEFVDQWMEKMKKELLQIRKNNICL